MPAAFLTFTTHRLRVLLARGLDPAAEHASGSHATEAEALAYARREGPAVVLTPAGELIPVGRARDAGKDAQIAADQRGWAERRWRLDPRPSPRC